MAEARPAATSAPDRRPWAAAVGAAVLGVALAVAPAAVPVAAEVPAPRQVQLRHLLAHDCGSCHRLALTGGLGLPLVPSALAGQSDSDLIAVILDGRPGTPMPPWRPLLSEEEATWLVRALRTGRERP